jgi:hypothetical protein
MYEDAQVQTVKSVHVACYQEYSYIFKQDKVALQLM